jgi:hypothetical protein
MTNRPKKYHPTKNVDKQARGTGDFFAEPSIDELAHAQNVKPFNDISDLAGGIPADQDIDEFLGEIYGSRR